MHRKCSGISSHDLNTQKIEVFESWECQVCMTDKFPFNETIQIDLIKLSFNSNFDCSCLTTSKFVQRGNIFNFSSLNYNENEYGPDPENFVDKSFELNLKFDYFTNHDFHKLIRHLAHVLCNITLMNWMTD